jgi:hypothetical protein
MTTPHDPTIKCEQFCDQPIGPHGDPGGDGWRACCPECDRRVDWLADEVLPAIRKYGYYAPPDADEDDELQAMIKQQDFRPTMLALLKELGLPDPVVGSWSSDIPPEPSDTQ